MIDINLVTNGILCSNRGPTLAKNPRKCRSSELNGRW